jgi:death-on-curing protein
MEEYGGEHGMLNEGALEAAVFRPQTGYYHDLSEEAAALLESLVNNHPFVDGNKRVGFAAAHVFLLVNGFDLDVSGKAAFEFMMKTIAEGKFRFALLRDWISAHLVPLTG